MPSSSSRPTKSAAKSVKSAPATRATKTAAKAAAPSRSRATARKPSTTAPALTHELIAQRAHDLYVQSGHQGHRQVEFWLEAERQLREGMKA